jgi:hypothetical protein
VSLQVKKKGFCGFGKSEQSIPRKMVDVDGIESVALPLTSSVLAAYVFPLEQLEQILKNLHFFTFYRRGTKTHSSRY